MEGSSSVLKEVWETSCKEKIFENVKRRI